MWKTFAGFIFRIILFSSGDCLGYLSIPKYYNRLRFINSAGNANATTPPERVYTQVGVGGTTYFMLKSVFKKRAGYNKLRLTVYDKIASTWTGPQDTEIILRVRNYTGAGAVDSIDTNIVHVVYTKSTYDLDISALVTDEIYQAWIGYSIDNKQGNGDVGNTSIYMWAPVLEVRPD